MHVCPQKNKANRPVVSTIQGAPQPLCISRSDCVARKFTFASVQRLACMHALQLCAETQSNLFQGRNAVSVCRACLTSSAGHKRRRGTSGWDQKRGWRGLLRVGVATHRLNHRLRFSLSVTLSLARPLTYSLTLSHLWSHLFFKLDTPHQWQHSSEICQSLLSEMLF